jgi:uncharacterized protein YndB with AHSA1/START domain
MSDNSFTTTFTVDQTPKEVFDAVNDVRGWWTEQLDGSTTGLGDEFTYRYGDVHRCRIRITESVPGEKVAWHVLENYFNFTQDATEWTGTTITFDISEQDGRTEVRFTHHGLVPAYECFDSCSQGWTYYVNTSLANLVTTGEGQPNGPEEPQTAAEAVTTREAG